MQDRKIPRRVLEELKNLEDETRRNYALHDGQGDCFVECLITGECRDCFWASIRILPKGPGHDFVYLRKFKIMKKGLSVIWSESWL